MAVPGNSAADTTALASAAVVAWNVPYLDPQAGFPAEPILDPELAAASEAALELSPSDRREVQRRLRLAQFDPKMIDGDFGPDTRAAIEDWQRAAGMPATGFIDGRSMSLLTTQTAEAYREWERAERARIEREEAANAVVTSSMPVARPLMAKAPEGCQRNGQGRITYGQSVSCDARGVREGFSRDIQRIGRLFR